MTTVAETERRAAIAVQMRDEGKTYDQIAEALGLRSRGHVNYYLNLERRRQQQRQFYLEHVADRRDYQAEYRRRKEGGFIAYGDRTAFKPETPRQSRMWRKLLAEARP
jgi:hypothetical protein